MSELIQMKTGTLVMGFAVATALGSLWGAEPALQLSAKLETPVVLQTAKSVHVLVRLRAQRQEGDGVKEPLNLALVLDRSGSMAGTKIADARTAAVQMLERMRDGDRVAVVSYSDEVRVDVESTVLNEETRVRVRNAIHRISSDGSTNLGGGLVEGLAQVRKHRGAAEGVNRVLLISDGLANRGIQDPKELNQIARKALQEGIVTTTIGLGEDYNEDLMTALADHGGGNYYFVQNSEKIANTLNDEVRQMAATVAKSVSLHVTLPDKVKLDKVFGWVPKEEGGLVIVPMGEFFSGQMRSVLWKFTLPDGLKEGEQVSLGKMGLTYKGVGDDGKLERFASEPLTIKVTTKEDVVLAAKDQEVAARVAEIELASRMEEAANLVATRQFDKAKAVLGQAVTWAKDAQGAMPAPAAASLNEAMMSAEKMQQQVNEAEHSETAQKAFTKGSKAAAQMLKKK